MQQNIRRYKFLLRRRAKKIDKQLTRHPLRMLAGLVMFSVVAAALLFIILNHRSITTSDSKIVILYVDHKSSTLPTREETVGSFLDKEKIKINEGDVVEPSLDAKVEEDNFRINVYRAAPVVVYDNGQKILGLSAAMTPRSIAEQTGVKLYPEDLVISEPSSDFLKDNSIGNKVVVTRAVPTSLNLYGSALNVRTQAKTVGGLLAEKHVKLDRTDVVTPSLSSTLTPETQVFVTRKGTQVVTNIEDIPEEVQTVQDNSLSFGTIVVRQAGSAGKKSVTYQVDLTNGVETGRHLIQEAIIQQPVIRVVARGQAVQIPSDKEGIMRAAGIADSDFPYVYFIINHENGLWCPTRYQGTSGCPEYYVEKFPGAETSTNTGYGLCQATPGIKMASAGDDWRTNAVTQLRWCSGYASSRYGGWEGAYEHWIAHNNW